MIKEQIKHTENNMLVDVNPTILVWAAITKFHRPDGL